MHHFPFHIDKYDSDTSELTDAQDLAYRRLLGRYYKREKPLPNDREQCYIMARAVTKAAREAVDYVLPAYFQPQVDGWHHDYADAVIATFHKLAETSRVNGRRRKTQQDTQQDAAGLATGIPAGTGQDTGQHPSRVGNHKPETINPSVGSGSESTRLRARDQHGGEDRYPPEKQRQRRNGEEWTRDNNTIMAKANELHVIIGSESREEAIAKIRRKIAETARAS